MTNILTAGHAAAVSTLSPSGVTWFLLIVAAAAGAKLSWGAPIGIFVVYLLLHMHGALSGSAPWIVTAVVALFIGWQLGGRSILRHVGEREYRTRLTAAKGINSMWQRWFGDPG